MKLAIEKEDILRNLLGGHSSWIMNVGVLLYNIDLKSYFKAIICQVKFSHFFLNFTKKKYSKQSVFKLLTPT